MNTILYIVLGIALFMILYQDLKDRAVEVLWLLLPGITGVVYLISDSANNIETTLYNLALITVLYAVVYLYFLLKSKIKQTRFQSFIGAGDVVFHLSLCTVMSPVSLVTLIVFGNIAGLLLLLLKQAKLTRNSIPLAGIHSGTLFVWLLFAVFLSPNSNPLLIPLAQ
ncbi:hypothetical protein [Salibacter halophilus]|uniref:Prepilin type IV endopeptidase peptidase domain-containing protein n=1 Tax=Salibacter halophilus TaxID=1803916 RepID=A0A6N6M445_9FLAO|nr:hypothetical protein [Salibacter halophilus]KAB1061961.1 hypothetical protein F3059_12850 [Salibacter halophilus]